MKENYKHIIVIVFTIVLLAFILKPAATGYQVYRDIQDTGNVNTYTTNMYMLNNKLNETQAAKEKCITDKDRMEMQTETLQNEVKNLTDRLQRISQTIKIKDAKIDERERLAQLTRDNYNALAHNAAKNICCKQKVDVPSINSYEIVNNMIFCSEGAENKLEC